MINSGLLKVYKNIGILLFIMFMPAFLTFFLALFVDFSFFMLLIVIINGIALLQPLLGVWYTRYAKKEIDRSDLSFLMIRKWFKANTVFMSVYGILVIVGIVYSIVTFDRGQSIYHEMNLPVPLSAINSLLWVSLLIASIYQIHTLFAFVLLKKIQPPHEKEAMP